MRTATAVPMVVSSSCARSIPPRWRR